MICNPLLRDCTNVTNPQLYAGNTLQFVFSLFFLVGIIYFAWHFVFAGYHFIASQGDTKKIEETKHELTYSFVGIAVVFSVFAILKLIGLIFSIPGLETLRVALPSL